MGFRNHRTQVRRANTVRSGGRVKHCRETAFIEADALPVVRMAHTLIHSVLTDHLTPNPQLAI